MKSSIFETGRNCWRVGKASHVSVLVDYASYYLALYQSIIKARHTIFIIGWDIDSRIRLVRGDNVKRLKNDKAPVTLRALLYWKAKTNPQIKIYLIKWDYSFF